MRKIIIMMDDAGAVQVEMSVDPNTNRFFTKRDFDRIVRSLKQKYRQSIREHRKKSIIKKYEIEKEQTHETQSEPEKGHEDDRKREEPGANSIRTREQSFAGAAEQAIKRSTKLSLRKGS